MERARVDEATSRAAVAATKAVAKKRAAAPSWATIRSKFDKLGGKAKLDAAGNVVGYRYPKSKDPEKQRKINAAVYEMWNPHRRVSMELGAAANAAREGSMVKVRAADGTTRLVLPEKAEKVDRAVGNRARFGYSRNYSNAPYWRSRKRA